MDLYCQTLLDPDQMQSPLVFTATPGTESYEKLQHGRGLPLGRCAWPRR
jgi:hypothetical protein